MAKVEEPFDDPRVQASAAAAKDLVEKRYRWLDPEGAREAELKKQALTNFYNARPTWLDLAHKRLDDAVLDAYAWPHDLTDDQILERLLALNLERTCSSKQPTESVQTEGYLWQIVDQERVMTTPRRSCSIPLARATQSAEVQCWRTGDAGFPAGRGREMSLLSHMREWYELPSGSPSSCNCLGNNRACGLYGFIP